MKKWMEKGIVLLFLSISLVMGMNSLPMLVNAGIDSEGAASADVGAGAMGEPGEGQDVSADARREIEYEAEVEVDGETIRYTKFVDAWKAMQGRTATICLLKTVDMEKEDTGGMEPGDTDNNQTLFLWPGSDITLKMVNGVELRSDSQYIIIHVKGGTFTLESGCLAQNGTLSGNCAFLADGGNVFIKGGEIKSESDAGLRVYSVGNVSISGGTFSGRQKAVDCEGEISEILANGYAFCVIDSDQNRKWIKNKEQMSNIPKVTVDQYPARFAKDPANIAIVYGDEMQLLDVEAEIVDQTAFDTGVQPEYQWYQKLENNYQIINGATSKTYTPEQKDAGTYEYCCKATCDWFSLYSKSATVTIAKKPLNIKIGEIVKDYDGTNVASAECIPLISLDGFVGNDNSDIVTASAIRAVYPSADAGEYTGNVKVELQWSGAGLANYETPETINTSGRIRSLPVTGISLNKNYLSLSRGSSEQLSVIIFLESSANQTLQWKWKWTTSSPAVAAVDENGRVTAIGAGSAVITVSTMDGKYSDSCTVTVVSSSNGSGSSSTDWSSSISREPFIKGSPAKRGWYIIRAEAKKAVDFGTDTLTVDMNGTYVVPGSFFTVIRGSEVTAVFEMGGISWSVYGKDILADTVRDTRFSIKLRTDEIPKELIEEAAEGFQHLELKLEHEGEFGFTAVITSRIGRYGDSFTIGSGIGYEYIGMYANLFYYNSALHRLEFICADKVREDGTVSLPFTRASDYTIILSESAMGGTDEPDNPQESAEPDSPQESDGPQEPEENQAQVKSVKLSKKVFTYSGKAKKPSVTAVDTAGNIIPSEYYTVSYKNNKKVGKATAVVKFKDGYSGTVKKTFMIRPAAVSIKEVTAMPSGFRVKWAKKLEQTSGYQIQYSQNAGFLGDSTRSIYVNKAFVAKQVVKNLKAGKKYYVRIRTYKKVTEGGKKTKVYSAWCRIARVRVLSPDA